MDDAKIKTTAMLLDVMFTKAFMKGDPGTWHENRETMIEVKIPMPKAVIEKLQELKESMDETAPSKDIDFNELLSMYMGDLVYIGLAKKVEHLPDMTEVIQKVCDALEVSNANGLS